MILVFAGAVAPVGCTAKVEEMPASSFAGEGKFDDFRESGGEWIRRPLDPGEVIDFGSGGYYPGPEQTWTLSQPGAAAIRVHFSRLDTPYGDVVRVMSPAGYDSHLYQGPANPAFWSAEIRSETVRIFFDPNTYASAHHRGFAIDGIEYFVNSHDESEGCESAGCPQGQRCEWVVAACSSYPCPESALCVDDEQEQPRIPGESCAYDEQCAGLDDHEGTCNGGVCMFKTSAESCASGAQDPCPSGSRCRSESGMAICYPDCDVYACDGVCDSDRSCVGP